MLKTITLSCRNRTIFSIVSFVLFMAGGLLVSPVTHALSAVFPDHSNHSPANINMQALVAIPYDDGQGVATGLNAPVNIFKIFIPTGGPQVGNINVDMKGICDTDKVTLAPPPQGIGGTGQFDNKVQVQAFRTKADRSNGLPISGTLKANYGLGNDCSGSDITFSIPLSQFNIAQSDPLNPSYRRYSNYRTALVQVDKYTGGQNSFKIQVSGGAFVTFDDISIIGAGGSQTPAQPSSSTYAFHNATQGRIDGANNGAYNGPKADYSFTFKPDCTWFDLGTPPIFLKWYGANAYGQTNQRPGIGWKLTGTNGFSSKSEFNAGRLGDNGYKASFPIQLDKNNQSTTYTWTWYNVDRTNGLRIWMPFSEGATQQSCPTQPTGKIVSGYCTWFSLRATIPPQSSSDIKFKLDRVNRNGIGTSPVIGTTSRNNDYANHTYYPSTFGGTQPSLPNLYANYYAGNRITFILSVWTGSAWQEVDRQAFTNSNCNSNNSACTPGYPVAAKSLLPYGGTTTISTEFTNNGQVDWPPNYTMRVRNNNNPWTGTMPLGQPVQAEQDGPLKTFPVGARRPLVPLTVTFTFQMYDNRGNPFGATCLVDITWLPIGSQRFDANDDADTQLLRNGVVDNENPNQVTWYARVINNGPATPVSIPTWALFYKTNGPIYDAYRGNRSYPAGPWVSVLPNLISSPMSIPPGTAKAGDQYCTVIKIDYTTGYVTPGGVVYGDPASAKTKGPICKTVVNEPYVHFFNSDVSAGGGFGSSGCNNPGAIKTYLNTTGSPGNRPAGSGAQLGALSIGGVEGFSSALLRNSFPVGSTDLTFANTGNILGGPPNPQTGGLLGGTHCATDYFAPAKSMSFPLVFSDDPSVPGIRYFTGPVKITAGTLGPGIKTTIYVKGDVEITGNISYGSVDVSPYNFGTIAQIPSLYIIAYGGKINIDSSVTQLDGVYISQPDTTGGGGTIDTCDAAIPDTSLITSCKQQLIVNGAFVAKQVYLRRAFGSLRDSQAGERYINGSPRTCSTDLGATPTSNGDCAAEIFNFSPEVYLAQPLLPIDDGPTTGTYKYITSLGPVL